MKPFCACKGISNFQTCKIIAINFQKNIFQRRFYTEQESAVSKKARKN